MARVLVYTSPALGHLFPALGLATQLAARGHDLRVATLAGEVERVRKLGLTADPIDPAIESLEMDDHLAKSPLGAVQRALRTLTARAPHGFADLERAIAGHRPEVVIVDNNSYGGLTAAEASGLPWCSYQPYFTPLPSKDVPPFGPGLAPARGPLGRIRDAILRPLIYGRLTQLAMPAVNELRERAGLEPLADIVAFLKRPPRTLYFTAEALEYPRSDWPASYVLVGPATWGPPAEAPSWLRGEQRPVVLVTCSTEAQGDRTLLQTALDALAREQLLVVATSAAQDPSSFEVPPNARVERFLPHGPILERAVAVLCHGGMGITQKALAAGVPVCVVPFGRDQLEVARRVERAGAGVRLMPRRLAPGSLRTAIEGTRRCAPAAARIASAFRIAGGEARAADVVEDLLAAVPDDQVGRERPSASQTAR